MIGRADDRHMITVAGSRAGKSSTVLIPNLKRHPGSCVVLDPKGELARATAAHRTRLGQRVFVLDPFGEVVPRSSCHNPFAELGQGRSDHVAADAAPDRRRSDHQQSARSALDGFAKNLVRGITLHLTASEYAHHARGPAVAQRNAGRAGQAVHFDDRLIGL